MHRLISILSSYFMVRGQYNLPIASIIMLREGHAVNTCVVVLEKDLVGFLFIIKDPQKKVALLGRVPYLHVGGTVF